MKCIYCLNELSVDERYEHIILESLGGKRKSRSIVCSTCNGQFSDEIDRPTAEAFEFFRCYMNIPVGDAPSKTFAKGAETGRRYVIYAGGYKEPEPKTEDLETEEGERYRRVSGPLHKAKEIVQGMKHSGRYSDVTVENPTHSWVREHLEPEKMPGTTDEMYRCVAKMSFNYLGNLAIRDRIGISPYSEIFDEIRDFITSGTNRSNDLLVCIDGRTHVELPAPEDRIYNRISILCSPDASSIISVVKLLGSLQFTVLLSRSYTGPKIGYTITNYPYIKGGDKEASFTNFQQITTDELLDRENFKSFMETFKYQLNILMKHLVDYDMSTYLYSVTRRVMKEMDIEEGTLEELSDDTVHRIYERVSEIFSNEFMVAGETESMEVEDWDEFMESI